MNKTYFYAALTAFVLSAVFCKILLPILRKLKAGQNILSYVEEHKSKSGTPTMGGLAFILASVVASVFFLRRGDRSAIVALAVGVGYLFVGFLDDYLKKRNRRNLGLRAWQKLVFQTGVAVFAGIYALRSGLDGVNLPFFGGKFRLGVWIVPFSVFVFLSLVNCVNLTDGLDGLAAGACLPFFLFLGLLIAVGGGGALATLSFALCGALAAYLLFNVSPASMFMGDTGSLALGGFASTIAVFSENTLYIPILGIMFVVSGISVILQVIYYKVTGGKRIFLMAPIHHHFQEKGFSEAKISYAYALITAVSGLVCLVFAL